MVPRSKSVSACPTQFLQIRFSAILSSVGKHFISGCATRCRWLLNSLSAKCRQIRPEALDNQLHTHYNSNAWVFMLGLTEKKVGATIGWWRAIGKVKK